MRDGSFCTSISEGRTIAIMLALYDSDKPLIMKDLLPIINHTQTLRARLDDMEEEGLVNLLIVREGHKHVDVWLTDMGKDAALMFSMADMLVSPECDLSGKSLDLKHADAILRMMNGKEFVVQKDILAMIHSHEAVTKVLSSMEEDGLITRTDNRLGGREIRYSLTPLGQTIARVYERVYQKIRSERHVSTLD